MESLGYYHLPILDLANVDPKVAKDALSDMFPSQNWTMVDSGGGIQQRDIDRAEKYFRFYLELLQIVEQETA